MTTKGDREILNALINPNLPIGEGVFDEENAVDDSLKDPDFGNTPELRESKRFEEESIAAAESGDLQRSLELLSKAVALTPNRPSCYNNRAQVHRLNGNVDKALEDLNKAIEMSNSEGRSACQAYTQRGLIHYRFGSKENAIKDFKRSADLGSDFAKSILTQLNPYAAMCNKMLKNVFRALEQGTNVIEDPFETPAFKKG